TRFLQQRKSTDYKCEKRLADPRRKPQFFGRLKTTGQGRRQQRAHAHQNAAPPRHGRKRTGPFHRFPNESNVVESVIVDRNDLEGLGGLRRSVHISMLEPAPVLGQVLCVAKNAKTLLSNRAGYSILPAGG